MLFHAGVTRVAGGYLGVDIFFAISGFVITQSIVRDFDENRFSLWAFYQRRASRILPALAATVLVTLAVGCILLLPQELRDLADSARAAAAFVSNLHFYARTSYFSGFSDREPLLHTWSLGVEEQFYLFYPLLLLVAAKIWRRRGVHVAVMVLVAGSFAAASVLTLRGRPDLEFYALPFRAWELGLGGMVALGIFPRISNGTARNLLAAAGLAMAVLSLLFVVPWRFNPAPWGLLACGGAALMIAYGGTGWTGRLLSLRPLQWIGAVSYSLYLWHWPIIVFYKLQGSVQLNMAETAMLIALSFAAAAISYYGIERPCQTALRRVSAPPLVIGACLASGLVALCAFGVAANALHWRHWDPAILRIAEYEGYADTPERHLQYRQGQCFSSDTEASYYVANCLRFSTTKRNVIVLGDSHSAQYWRAIALKNPDANVMQASAIRCFPVLRSPGPRSCTDLMRNVLGPLAASGRVDRIILSARWNGFAIPDLENTIRHLEANHVKVTVIGPTVEYGGPFPLLLARALWRHDLAWLDRLRAKGPGRHEQRMRAIVARTGATYFSEQDRECPAGKCLYLAPDGVPLHFDYGHLTMSGATYIVAAMPPV